MARTILAGTNIPDDLVCATDDQGRTWIRRSDGQFHTLDSRHRESPTLLVLRTDLVESDGERTEIALGMS